MTATPESFGPRPARPAASPLSRPALDSAVARSAAGFGIAFLLQSLPQMLDQLPNMSGWWTATTVTVLYASLLFATIASIARRWVHVAHSSFAFAYALALITWPFAVISVADAPRGSFFLYFVLTIATASATIGLGPRLGTIYLIVVPTIYAVIRTTPAGGGVSAVQAILDSVYSVILGGVITIIIVVLRRAATSVDQAQETALERYGHAVRQHAVEAERVQVDAIVHDSVLTTLLSAARADTPDARRLAATMAGNAIGHLRDAAAVGPEVEGEVRGAVVASRIEEAIATLSGPFEVRRHDVRGTRLPLPAAEAVYAAAVQAMVNSLQHAEASRRWVDISGGGDTQLRVMVGDDGQGFDPVAVPTERLGVRVSILDRLASAGGHAEIDSAPGLGTRVTLEWPATDATRAGS